MSDPQYWPTQTFTHPWLISLGFVRGNPFATTAADQERNLLPQFYVDVEGYEQIKGDETVIVFAPRGGGKSTLRVVLANQAAPLTPGANTLAVEFTDFDLLLRQYRQLVSLTIEDYIPVLLKTGVEALLNALCGLVGSRIDIHTQEIFITRANLLDPADRAEIAGIIGTYNPNLLTPGSIFKRLQALDAQFQPEWRQFTTAATDRRLRQSLAFSGLAQNPIALLLADLNDFSERSSRADLSPREQVVTFADLADRAGFTTVQFLIDRVDEYQETADNPVAQADILEPLLANLPILELPGVAFRFFLSQEARNVLLARPIIRRDRLTDRAVTVVWTKELLRHLLSERLAVFSDDTVSSLSHLCEEGWIKLDKNKIVRLDEWLEAEMLQVAQGSPRRLLVAGQLLCETHFARDPAPGSRLKQEDWEKAKLELIKKMPSLLRLNKSSRTVWVGDRKIAGLTKLDYRILMALADAPGGQCSRDDLAREAWESKSEEAVSNETIDQAIRRLRGRLNDDANQPIYIVTERGMGYRLRNFVQE